MNEIEFFGEESDYLEIEAACKADGIEFTRRPVMYRNADMSSQEVLVIIFVSTAASIKSISKAVMAVAKAYEAKQKKKFCYTDGYGLHYFQNYKPEELEKVLPKTVAMYFGDAAPDDHPDYHRDDENAT